MLTYGVQHNKNKVQKYNKIKYKKHLVRWNIQ